MNKYKKFIKDAYNGKLGLTMCQEWKQKIECKFPELLPKPKIETLEIGKWYRILNPNILFCFSGKYGDCTQYGFYGFNLQSWSTALGLQSFHECYLATEEEIAQALIKEAEKRGFKEGVLHNTIQHETDKIRAKANIYGYNQHENKLIFNNWCIFQNGKWCETFENTITRAEAEKQLNAKIID